jgi:hypothetical protein
VHDPVIAVALKTSSMVGRLDPRANRFPSRYGVSLYES